MKKLKNISIESIRELQDIFDNNSWKKLSSNYAITYEMMKEFQDKLNWDCLSQCQQFTIDMLNEFEDKINWDLYSRENIYKTKDIVIFFKHKINWFYVIDKIDFSKNEVEYYLSKYIFPRYENVKIYFISASKMTNEFIRENVDRFDWTSEKMIYDDETFLEEFKDKIKKKKK